MPDNISGTYDIKGLDETGECIFHMTVNVGQLGSQVSFTFSNPKSGCSNSNTPPNMTGTYDETKKYVMVSSGNRDITGYFVAGPPKQMYGSYDGETAATSPTKKHFATWNAISQA